MTRIENVLLRWGGKVMMLAIGVWVAAILGIFAGAWRLRWPCCWTAPRRAGAQPTSGRWPSSS